MAITLILGKPGAGKSYEAVRYNILPMLEQGRMVVTNIPLNLEAFRKINPEYITKIVTISPTLDNLRPFSREKDFTDYHSFRNDKGHGVFFVIDECHMSVPSATKSCDRGVLEWYAMHRHHCADVLLITQSKHKVNRSVLALVSDTIILMNNGIFGSRGSYIRKVKVDDMQVGQPVVRKYDKEYFAFYTTHTGGTGNEDKFGASKTIFHSWIFKLLLLVIPVMIYCVYSLINNPILKKNESSKEVIRTLPRKTVSNDRNTTKESFSVDLNKSVPLEISTDKEKLLFSGYQAAIVSIINGDYLLKLRSPDGQLFYASTSDLFTLGYDVKFSPDRNSVVATGKNDSFIFARFGSLSIIPLPVVQEMKKDNLSVKDLSILSESEPSDKEKHDKIINQASKRTGVPVLNNNK